MHRSLMKNFVLRFCGVKTKGATLFGPVEKVSAATRKQWISKVEKLGRKLK